MKREEPEWASRRPLASDHSESSSAAPTLVVVVELEELPRIRVLAETFEDERRLVGWASMPATVRRIEQAIAGALDDLDDLRHAA